MMSEERMKIASCHCCGLAQRMPEVISGFKPVCARCGAGLLQNATRRNRIAAALSASALLFYLPAMFLPMLRIEQLGHHREESLISGAIALLSQGDWLVGGIVLVCSALLPLFKLAILLFLSVSASPGTRPRALMYRLVQLIGRWGMLDVMLMAILLAFIRLESLVRISSGPGLIAFAALVLLSLAAGAAFNPRLLWTEPA